MNQNLLLTTLVHLHEKKKLPSDNPALKPIFSKLDYKKLGSIYCDEGGEAFWKDRKIPCQKLGARIAQFLLQRLPPTGCSLYMGAGVAEIPILCSETSNTQRSAQAYNLRSHEVHILNQACSGLPFSFTAGDAQLASGSFDHLWAVSVLNDPECFPEVSAISYGRANPASVNIEKFSQERERIRCLVNSCMKKLTRSGLVTTSVEEIGWFTEWCDSQVVGYEIIEQTFPTAIVGDPVCFIRVLSPD